MFQKILEFYIDKNGHIPILEWLETLDGRTQACIRNRLTRLELGNFGDCKPVGDGVSELKFAFGPGYRVYFGEVGRMIVLLLCGGDKSTQSKDIKRAKHYWKRYEEHIHEQED